MPERRSALSHLRSADDERMKNQIYLVEIPHTGKFDLRGDPEDRVFLSAVGAILGLVLPTEPNTVTAGDGVTALWAGPDEWILVTEPGEERVLELRLQEAMADTDATIVDLTDARTVIRLRGPCAASVIEKSCMLDLHPCAFAAGQVAQTRLAGISVMLHHVGEDGEAGGSMYDIYVPRSSAEHFWRWLCDAAVEYEGDFRSAK